MPRRVMVLPQMLVLSVPQGESGDSAQRHGYCNKVYLLRFLFLHMYLLEIHFVMCVPRCPFSLCISFFYCGEIHTSLC